MEIQLSYTHSKSPLTDGVSQHLALFMQLPDILFSNILIHQVWKLSCPCGKNQPSTFRVESPHSDSDFSFAIAYDHG